MTNPRVTQSERRTGKEPRTRASARFDKTHSEVLWRQLLDARNHNPFGRSFQFNLIKRF